MGQEKAGKKVNKIRYNEYYGTQARFDDLYRRSQNGEVFTSLMELIADPDNIMLAFRNIKSNHGSTTPGVDGRTIEYFADLPQEQFIGLIQRKLRNYHPKPVKRAEIPKPNGKLRPLGIPCMLDRIIQQCILQVLEPICEARFYEESYGFRPFRSAEHAAASLQNRLWNSGTHYIVDVDIEGFFDNVDHKILRRQLWSMGIRDTRLLAIIREILRAPVLLPDKTLIHPTKGTPQGGIISPLLANIVLNDLDWWIHSQWLGQVDRMKNPPKQYYNARGIRIFGKEYNELRKSNLKEMYLVRCADDFKICCRSRDDAEKVLFAVTKWLKERLHLSVSKEKTKITNVRRHCTDFLGIRMRVMGYGKRARVRSHMTDKAIQSAVEKIGRRIHAIKKAGSEKELNDAIDRFNSTVNGLHNYFKMAACVSQDFCKISRRANPFDGSVKGLKNKGPIKESWIREKHGRSGQLRWLNGRPLVPPGHIKYKFPYKRNKKVCMYTVEGRQPVHDPLELNTGVLYWLLTHPEPKESVAYNDNRLSLFAGQYGKCRLTDTVLTTLDTVCLRKKPLWRGGDDSCFNLILIRERALPLICSGDMNLVHDRLAEFNIGKKEREYINHLRRLACLSLIR